MILQVLQLKKSGKLRHQSASGDAQPSERKVVQSQLPLTPTHSFPDTKANSKPWSSPCLELCVARRGLRSHYLVGVASAAAEWNITSLATTKAV